ncbi:hypothetical protein [Pengzhenrongella sicca]|uniref:Uncharacterized protein n=1 Tax=Pengzhenrongella sicca TaxID=2819238 RepID=A0A8A4ZHW1_9MICO|nr:hypothetical protein [Pengzhenrongella sicca]QTE30107.1 hypothetical protein J4E96_03555 [Pengzhenrongella sicca]
MPTNLDETLRGISDPLVRAEMVNGIRVSTKRHGVVHPGELGALHDAEDDQDDERDRERPRGLISVLMVVGGPVVLGLAYLLVEGYHVAVAEWWQIALITLFWVRETIRNWGRTG